MRRIASGLVGVLLLLLGSQGVLAKDDQGRVMFVAQSVQEGRTVLIYEVSNYQGYGAPWELELGASAPVDIAKVLLYDLADESVYPSDVITQRTKIRAGGYSRIFFADWSTGVGGFMVMVTVTGPVDAVYTTRVVSEL